MRPLICAWLYHICPVCKTGDAKYFLPPPWGRVVLGGWVDIRGGESIQRSRLAGYPALSEYRLRE
ncbi:hypothetical protein DESC_480073 [Desulfosarcina cetonica]|nr:hypothetical protein DESC_480073 [Desulfosarcina cetonica]